MCAGVGKGRGGEGDLCKNVFSALRQSLNRMKLIQETSQVSRGGSSVAVLFLCVDGWFHMWRLLLFFIPRHTIVAGYYGFTLDVRVSVRPSVIRQSVRFSFPDDNLSKLQWIFIKLGMRIDIVDLWFGIANGQISSIFYGVICPRHALIL